MEKTPDQSVAELRDQLAAEISELYEKCKAGNADLVKHLKMGEISWLATDDLEGIEMILSLTPVSGSKKMLRAVRNEIKRRKTQ